MNSRQLWPCITDITPLTTSASTEMAGTDASPSHRRQPDSATGNPVTAAHKHCQEEAHRRPDAVPGRTVSMLL